METSHFLLAPSPPRALLPAYSDQPISAPGVVNPETVPTDDVAQLIVPLRGMAVEDDHNVHHNPEHSRHYRAPPMLQTQAYGTYPQPDYNPYYLHSRRDPYVDYQYGYPPSDPSLYGPPAISAAPLTGPYQGVGAQIPHLNAVPEMHRQPGSFYEYGAARQASQLYYASHQAVMYPHPPSSMIAPQAVGSLVDKKHEAEVCLVCFYCSAEGYTPSSF